MRFKKLQIKSIFLIIIFTIYSRDTISQINIEFTIPNVDFNHYSVEQEDEDYYIAGTLYDKNSSLTNFHVFKLTANGTVAWETIINLNNSSSDDRLFDLCIGANNEIAITGYTSPNGPFFEQELVLSRLNKNTGNVISSTSIKGQSNGESLVGTNIIYNPNNQEYVVGGFLGNYFDPTGPNPIISNCRATITRFNQIGTYISQQSYSSTGGADDNQSINDITIINNNYFILGTHSNGPQTTSVLLLEIDPNTLNITQDFSYESPSNNGFSEIGVSLYYDQTNNTLFVLSNIASAHSPAIDIIDLSTNSFIGGYILNLLQNKNPFGDPSGFKLSKSNNTGTLYLSGLFKEFDNNSSAINNSSGFIVEFNKSTGTIINKSITNESSHGFSQHGGPFFSANFMNKEHSLIYNQELMVADKNEVLMLAPILTSSGDFGLQIFKQILIEPIPCFLSFQSSIINLGERTGMTSFEYTQEPTGSYPLSTNINSAMIKNQLCNQSESDGEFRRKKIINELKIKDNINLYFKIYNLEGKLTTTYYGKESNLQQLNLKPGIYIAVSEENTNRKPKKIFIN